MTEPTKPAPAAAPKRPTFPHLIKALQGDEKLGVSTTGACILLAHALVELGETKVGAMKGDGIRAYAVDLLRRVPMAWSSVRMGLAPKFLKALDMYKLEHEKIEHYQAEIQRLTPEVLPKELLDLNRTALERRQAQAG